MKEIYNIMLEESRQNFFQLENLTSYLDMKAFGIVAVDAILLPIYVDILSKYSIPLYYHVPSLFLVVSLVFMVLSVRVRAWKRQKSSNTIENYGRFEDEKAATQLALNYVGCENELYKVYDEKLRFFKTGAAITGISLVLIFFALASLFFS